MMRASFLEEEARIIRAPARRQWPAVARVLQPSRGARIYYRRRLDLIHVGLVARLALSAW